MSRFEDEEEDELQMILEGRDIQEYNEDYIQYRKEDNSSELSILPINDDYVSDEDIDNRQNTSNPLKKQRFEESLSQRKDKNKRKIDSSITQSEDISHQNYGNNEINETDVKVKVKVRRIVTRIQPKLNAEKLMSNEGIAFLPQLFDDFKFGQKGSELKDLNAIMFRLSHWSHRLFPSLTFDDFIEKCEHLGNKRAVKNFIAKIRYDSDLNINPNECPLEDDDRQQNQDFRDSIEKDFDYIFANNYKNINENNESQDLQTNGRHSANLVIEDNEQHSQTLNESQINSEIIDKQNVSETEKHIEDSNDEELSEEQILEEINADNDII